jgi:hypothetical protein
MDSKLRGSVLPSPRFRIAPLPEELKHVNGFTGLQTFFPTLSKLYRLSKHQSEDVWLDSKWRIVSLDISGTSGPCRLGLVPNTEGPAAAAGGGAATPLQRPAFLKVTHLLDPIRWMKGQYSLPKHTGLPWHNKTWATASAKLQDPWNQAYVESLASYALGRLREEGVSPHFNEFYGAFCARAGVYKYNLTDEFYSLRESRWFWTGQQKGLFSVSVHDPLDPTKAIDKEVLDDILNEPSDLNSDESSCSEEEGDAEEEEIMVGGGDTDADDSATASIHSDDFSELSFEDGEDVVVERRHGGSASTTSSDEGDEDDDEGDEDEYKIFSVLRDFPVMLIAVEENRGTMDSLMDNEAEVGAAVGTPEWEQRWSAWIFQVIAALAAAQSLLGLTHNDLHTNNVVWTPTEEEYLYYKKLSGEVFRIPTFGKLFRVIDFGRAIFTINGEQFISDDFRHGNDAAGQYNFKPLFPRPAAKGIVAPNASFDLCRLAVSMIEPIFPDRPEPRKGGKTLSSEKGLVVQETVSDLYNVIWSWMIDDDGKNVLIEPNGDERFPDFGLYKHIAAKVHGAVPSLQFQHPAFDKFQIRPVEVPAGQKCWHLFS